jgi:isocitrate dehydrogenase
MATIAMTGGKLNVPNQPTIPFIEGDGTGPDIWKVRVMQANRAFKLSASFAA